MSFWWHHPSYLCIYRRSWWGRWPYTHASIFTRPKNQISKLNYSYCFALPETNSSPLKMDGWETFSFPFFIASADFQVQFLSFTKGKHRISFGVTNKHQPTNHSEPGVFRSQIGSLRGESFQRLPGAELSMENHVFPGPVFEKNCIKVGGKITLPGTPSVLFF